MRVGSHDGFDRVVIELNATSASGLAWWVEYTTEPRTQGKGDLVELPGEAVLAVRLQGIAYSPEGDAVLHGRQDASAHGNVTAVYVDPQFESQVQVFIGLDAQRGFHVSTQDSPARLVIDIQHSAGRSRRNLSATAEVVGAWPSS